RACLYGGELVQTATRLQCLDDGQLANLRVGEFCVERPALHPDDVSNLHTLLHARRQTYLAGRDYRVVDSLSVVFRQHICVGTLGVLTVADRGSSPTVREGLSR